MHELAQARKLGLIYYKGARCPNCSRRARYVSNRSCIFCTQAHYNKARATRSKAAWRSMQRELASPMARLYLAAMGATLQRRVTRKPNRNHVSQLDRSDLDL